MMKKKAIITTILILIIIGASCGSIYFYNREHNVIENKEEVKSLIPEKATIEDFKEKLEKNGVIIEAEAENKESKEIGASRGYTYMISDKIIQVYEYDFNNTDELTVSNIKLAKEEGKVIMPLMNNLEINVKYNKGLVLINYQEHPEKEKIIEAFDSL